MTGALSVSTTTGRSAYFASDNPNGTNNHIAIFRDNETANGGDGLGTIAITSAPGQDVYFGKRFRDSDDNTFAVMQNSSGGELFTLNLSTGNLGLGTDAPAHKLHVKTTSNALSEPIALFENDTGGGGDVSIRLEGGATGNADEIYIEFSDRSDTSNSFTIGLDDDASKLQFGYGAKGTTNSHTQMTLDSDGKVGIGTTSPDQKLHIYGSSGNTYAKLESNANNTRSALLPWAKKSDGSTLRGYVGVTGDANKMEVATTTNDSIHFYTNNNPTDNGIFLKENGKVGIGLTSPDAKLHVNGAAIVGSNTNQSTTPIAGLHVIDNAYSHWSSTLSKQQVALRVETYWNASAGQRNTGKYGSGIGFNHLGGHSQQHDENVHGWIGLRVVDTPGHERSALVFATNNVTTDEDAGILERASISPEGRFTFKQFSSNSSQIHNSVGYTDLYKFSFSMNMMGNQAYVIRTSGHGNGILRIMAQGSHWSSPYGLWRESYCMLDNNSTLSESNMHNQTSSQQGSWSFSRHSATEVDIVKAAGTYAGGMLTNIIIYSPRVVNVVGVY